MGEPCAPYRIVRVRHGTQRMVEHVQGRKHPLLDIRRQALTDHFQYMRLQKRETHLAASRVELEGLVGQSASHMSESELRQHVDKSLALRHFAVWQDHSTLCGCGYIMVTCKEVYDKLVHYTDPSTRHSQACLYMYKHWWSIHMFTSLQ